ncbi:MAG: hypothetical protein A2V70_11075 [Planctomycetes bacterium RBG_13_63_9]|nr:MAG: hypothetical protein A2V70_11075 [Planctomycetes bacterium RBG_13_63_9]
MKYLPKWLCLFLTMFVACSCRNVLDVRSQSPDDVASGDRDVRLVGSMVVPFGMFPIRVEAVGLVTGLRGTGSDPAPSAYRAALLDEMQTRRIPNPNAVLASRDTALVVIRGVLRPGIQKGDRFDLEVRIPERSETTSLRGGYLLESRLKEMALLDNQFHEGHLLALAEGPVMVDPSADGKHDRVLLGRGRVLGGGLAVKSRPLGLVLKPGQQNVRNSSRVANAVNRRFHTFLNGVKVGVAKAKTDEYIELRVHPKYKDNIDRYVHVVGAVALEESAPERKQRTERLKHQLLEPTLGANAALELEAIGTEGAETLLTALESADLEARFYAAEALAYIGRREAAKPLGEAARREPAFRVFALTALSAMDDFAAYEQLRELLDVPSAETRYGAFRALWAMNPEDALVLGERLGGQFSYHVLGTNGPPMIHVTRNRRPEIVLFGQHQRFLSPLTLNAGNRVMVTGCGPDEIAVSKYAVGEADQQRIVSTEVDEVIRAVVELGGTYPDVVQALQEAKAAGALPSRFEVDALPQAGRAYDRVADGRPDKRDTESGQRRPQNPVPEMFSVQGGHETSHTRDTGDGSEETASEDPTSAERPRPLGGFFARMMGRESGQGTARE